MDALAKLPSNFSRTRLDVDVYAKNVRLAKEEVPQVQRATRVHTNLRDIANAVSEVIEEHRIHADERVLVATLVDLRTVRNLLQRRTADGGKYRGEHETTSCVDVRFFIASTRSMKSWLHSCTGRLWL